MTVAGVLSASVLLLGAAFGAAILWSLLQGRTLSPSRAATGRARITVVLGIGFGVALAGEGIARLAAGPTLQIWMQVVAGGLLAVAYSLLLFSQIRPDIASPLILRGRYRMTPAEEAEADVEALARAGDTLLAVRAYRAQTGVGLHDAVTAVRAMQRGTVPDLDGSG